MISAKSNPVAWALMVQGIEDAREHIASLVEQMSHDGTIEEEDFAVQLGHAYAHLNRAWNTRNLSGEEISDEEWDIFSRFPQDISPIG